MLISIKETYKYKIINILGIKITIKKTNNKRKKIENIELINMLNNIQYEIFSLKKELLISKNVNTISAISQELNNNEPFVSVIISVYNIGEKYLIRCLDTIINQSLKNIEIIIVNDKSPLEEDHKICMHYKNKDSRIKYIVHDVNKGLGETRLTGLREATGYAVSFIDGDDFTSLNLYEITFNEMIKNHVDIVSYNFFNVIENNGNFVFNNSHYDNIPYTVFFGKDVLNIFCNSPIVISGYTWTKLIKRSLLLKLGFKNVVNGRYMYDDMNYGFKIFYLAESVLYLPYHLYFYVSNRSSSIMNSMKLKDNYFSDLYYVFLDMYEFTNRSSNENITQLFLSNLNWLYYHANSQNTDHYIEILQNTIIKLLNDGVLNREYIVKNIEYLINNEEIKYFIKYLLY